MGVRWSQVFAQAALILHVALTITLSLLLVLFLLANGGCAATAATGQRVDRLPGWCFAAQSGLGGAVGCFDTPRLCARARGLALVYGPVAGILTVGVCGPR